MLFNQKSPALLVPVADRGNNISTVIATYRPNQPSGGFIKNLCLWMFNTQCGFCQARAYRTKCAEARGKFSSTTYEATFTIMMSWFGWVSHTKTWKYCQTFLRSSSIYVSLFDFHRKLRNIFLCELKVVFFMQVNISINLVHILALLTVFQSIGPLGRCFL